MHLSVAVPAGCGNNCKFCIAKMQRDNYRYCGRRNLFDEYARRMAYAKDAGCSSLTLTGEGEPLMNLTFLNIIGSLNRGLSRPFYHIQLQTSGMTLLNGDTLDILAEQVGVTGISLSLCSFDSAINAQYTQPQRKEYAVAIQKTCDAIVQTGLSLRLCLNLTDHFRDMGLDYVLAQAKRLGASQLTFRELFTSDTGGEQNRWIELHRAHPSVTKTIEARVRTYGRPLPDLGSGLQHFSLDGLSVVIDSDCMSMLRPDVPRTLVLREDGKLYSRWDDRGSLIF